ncbi:MULTISPECIES: GNAT family N-acetyltransferase [unclassified Burkholderia]
MNKSAIVAAVDGWQCFKHDLLRARAQRSNGGWANYFLLHVGSDEAGLMVLDILDRPPCAVIREIYVLPDFRQGGLGDQLLSHAQTVAEHRLLRTLKLEVRPLDASTSLEWLTQWYLKRGFREDPTRPAEMIKEFAGSTVS